MNIGASDLGVEIRGNSSIKFEHISACNHHRKEQITAYRRRSQQTRSLVRGPLRHHRLILSSSPSSEAREDQGAEKYTASHTQGDNRNEQILLEP